MFDNIVILKTANKDSLIDVGLIAESLLFYDKVHLLLTRGTIHSLLNDLGAEGFDRLLERPEIRASLWNQNFGTVSNSNGGLKAHNFAVFEVGRKGGGTFKAADTIEEIIERSIGKEFASRKRIKNIVSRLSFPRMDDTLEPDEFVEGARLELSDRSFLQDAIKTALGHLLPNVDLPARWHFEVMRLSDGSFAVDTDVDFRALNLEYHILDADGHIIGCVPLICGDDVEARVKAERLVNGHDIELWNGARRVIRFSRKQK
jgi:hypothetical protein